MLNKKEVFDFIEEWCLLYPPDAEFGGRKLRSKPKDCVNKMVKLCKDNPLFTKDVIFAATKRYLAEQKARRWEYTKQATYFISKQSQPSVLEEYCNKVLAGEADKPIIEQIEYNPIDDFI